MSYRKRYYLQQYSQTEYWHGGIGYAHVEELLERDGFIPISFPPEGYLARLFSLIRWSSKLQPGDLLALVYPVYPTLYNWLLRAAKAKGVELLVIIGDIDGLKDDDAVQLKKDIHFFREQKRVLVHNEAMAAWMHSVGVNARLESIDFFPFLAMPATKDQPASEAIVFAGNLGKSQFLVQLDQPELASIHFHVYGDGLPTSMELPSNVIWKGRFPPAAMPGRVEGRFGLLWDGEAWDHAEGSIGRYMAYISHHKLSLYILAGLPLLVPRTAGAAALVEKEEIGIVFNSLRDIEGQIKKLSEESFAEMRLRLIPWSMRLSDGSHFLAALHRLMRD